MPILHRRSARVVVLVLASILTLPVLAQATDPQSTRYRLAKGSTYQEGCFAPCECPLLLAVPLEGRFTLRPAGRDWLYRYYDVQDVDWRFGPPDRRMRIRGSGTYRVGGEFAAVHQLTLDLQIDGGPVERFDSGLVVGGSRFPRIDVVISLHGMFCYDKVLTVAARPAPDLAVDRGRLSWLPVELSTGFDVMSGDLGALRRAGGDFASVPSSCLAADEPGLEATFDGVPPPGEAYWFAVRYRHAGGGESYDADSLSQVTSRDPGIDAAPGSCP